MAKRKILIVIAARPHYGRLKSVLRAIQSHPNLELQLIVAASALLDFYGCVDVIEKDGFTIDERIHTVIEGDLPQTMATTTGLFAVQLANSFARLKPDIVLVHADRYEQLAVAYTASYMNIKLGHTQGGEVSGSVDERVRHAITKLADIHFPATELSRQRIIRMGEDPDMVFNVGCPSIDLIANVDLGQQVDYIKKYGGVGGNVDFSKPYPVVIQHPVTTEYGEGLHQINETIKAVKMLQMPTAWLWPNVDSGTDHISEGIRRFREKEKPDYIRWFKNLEPEDYARLLYNCACLIGNTSSGIREGAYLGTPYVVLGSRQSGREHGSNVIFADHDHLTIYNAVKHQLNHGRYPRDYRFGNGRAGEQIAEILARVEVKEKKLTY